MLNFIRHKAIKPLVFLLVFVVLFSRASSILVNPGMYNFQMMDTFKDEPEGSLDAIYIGASTSFTLFQGPIAWEKYGMTVRMFSSDSQPMACRENFIRYARKSHPDALYIITVSPYYTTFDKQQMHWTTDFFPFSVEKYRMISKLTSLSDYGFWQKMEMYVPFIQFHSRWLSVGSGDFYRESNGLKGAFTSSTFLETAVDVTDAFHTSEELGELSEESEAYYNDLLDYCDETNLNALFVIPPSCYDEERVKEYNSFQSLIESRGYPVINFVPLADELELDFTTDYYNAGHTNVHGSLKVTDYIADYLHENYSFEDKRDNPDYASWEDAYDSYKTIIAPYLSEDELEELP